MLISIPVTLSITVTLQVAVLLFSLERTVTVAVPGALAVITPEEDTYAILLSETEKV